MKKNYTLFVSTDVKSKKAIKLCQESLKGVEIIDVSKIEPLSAGIPRPRLLAPEGRFIHLEGIIEYVHRYGKHGSKERLVKNSELWTLLPVLSSHSSP